MPRKGLHMVIQEEIQRLKTLGLSQRKIGDQLGINRKTVQRYWQGTIDPYQNFEPSWVQSIDWEHIESELGLGITREILYSELGSQHELPSYQNFCKQIAKKIQKKVEVTVRITRVPGASVEVDYAGDSIDILNPATGEVFSTELFVGTMTYSKKIFADFTFSQKLEDFISSHVKMFEFYGGLPGYIVCDNLKSGVTKSCKLDPVVNKTYHDMCSHYGLVVDPADSYKPRHKGNVEKAVDVIQRGFMQEVRGKTYTSLGQLNGDVILYLEGRNHKPMRHNGVSREELFEKEKPLLKGLPEYRYKIFYWKLAKVHADCHIQLEKNFYSVPFAYVGCQVEVKHNKDLVEIYSSGERVAVHKTRGGRGQTSTNDAHYPEKKVVEMQLSYQRLNKEAGAIGEKTKELVLAMFNEHRFPLKNLRRVQAVVSLTKRHTREAIEYGADKALLFNKLSYKYVESCAKSFSPKKPSSKGLTPNRNKKFICLQGGE